MPAHCWQHAAAWPTDFVFGGLRREVVTQLRTAYAVSERRACRATGFARATQRYRSVADPQDELRLRLRELAAVRVRYGYRRLWLLLRREGYAVNH